MGSKVVKFMDDVLGMDVAEDARTEQIRKEKTDERVKEQQNLYNKRNKIARNNEKVKNGEGQIESGDGKSQFSNQNIYKRNRMDKRVFANENQGMKNKNNKLQE